MQPILTLVPPARINDQFPHRGEIDVSPIDSSVFHPIVKGLPNDPTYRYQSDFYQNIACDIVVETVFDYPYPYITEKTLRPIACKRMFILIASQGCLLLLKKYGIMTFDDIIDESYDSIADPHTRYKTVIAEIRRFCCLPMNTIKEYMKQNQHKLEHNFNTLTLLHDCELMSISKQLDINY